MTTHWSIALRDIPAPDYADAVIIPLAPGDSVDPAAWARRIFSARDMPFWVKVALGATGPEGFLIREHGDDEVLVAPDDGRVAARWGVAVDEEARLLRVTTTVRRNGLRPVLPVPLAVRAMVRIAARSWRSPAL